MKHGKEKESCQKGVAIEQRAHKTGVGIAVLQTQLHVLCYLSTNSAYPKTASYANAKTTSLGTYIGSKPGIHRYSSLSLRH